MHNIIQNRTNGNYGFDPVKNLYFENYINDLSGYNLIFGVDGYRSGVMRDGYKNVIIDFEEPNFVENIRNLQFSDRLHKKLTLCPYSAEIYNKLSGTNQAEACFFPVDHEYIKSNLGDPTFDKPNDVLYIGGNHSPLTSDFLHLSYKPSMPGYLDKFSSLYSTKISICHNVLFYHNVLYLYNNLIGLFPEHENGKLELPQLKSRIFESGFSRCIPLVYFHKSRVVERYFTPDVDFIYFNDTIELKEIINRILSDYDNYKHIAESAYKKCMENYKLSDFIHRYLQ